MSDPTSEVPRPQPDTTADRTTEFARPVAGLSRSQLALVSLAIAAAGFLVGIAIVLATRPASEQTVVASQEVGPDGGVVPFDGGEIRIPAGALRSTERFVVRRSRVGDDIRVEADESLVVEGDRVAAYSFEPDDLTFARPVELTLRLPDGARNGSMFARTTAGVVLLTGTIDVSRGTATTTLRDFRFVTGNGS